MKLGLVLNKEIHLLTESELKLITCLADRANQVTLIIIISKDKQTGFYSLASRILLKQFLLEKKRFDKSNTIINKNELFDHFKNSVIEVHPFLKNDCYIFDKKDISKIRNTKLDLIIKLGGKRLNGEVIKATKYGVWFIDNLNKFSNSSLPIGFWEIVKNKSNVKISLIKLSENDNQEEVIDQSYFNYHKWSAILTNNMVIESSTSLILKNLNNLEQNKNNLLAASDKNDLNLIKEYLSFKDSFKYISKFYKFYFKGYLKKIRNKTHNNPKLWTLFIGAGNFLDQDLSKLYPVIVPNGEFWADPFLIKRDEEYYAFFENYSFNDKKGKISCGRVKGNRLVDVIDVLNLDYHLSYPFIFKEKEEVFMMPETGSNKRLEIYRCINFPDKWELFSTAFEGENIADAFFYDDANNQKWLFLNKSTLQNSSKTSNLFIYKVDSLELNEIIPHKQNPVIIDSRKARNGGSIFSSNNTLFRPSQRNTHGTYGNNLNINKIEKLTINEYVEKTVKIVKPDFYKGLKAIHHLHQVEGLFIFDASFTNIY